MFGYKVLRVTPTRASVVITSPLYAHVWMMGWNRARGKGFYSFSDPAVALYFRNKGIVVQVELAGTVEIHEHGFISEYCKITGVFRDNGIANTLRVPLLREPKRPEVSYQSHHILNAVEAYRAWLSQRIGNTDGTAVSADLLVNSYLVTRYWTINALVPDFEEYFLDGLPMMAVQETLETIGYELHNH